MSKVISKLAKRFIRLNRITQLRKKLGRVDKTLGKSKKFRPASQRPFFNSDPATKVERLFFKFSRDTKKINKRIRVSNSKATRKLRRFSKKSKVIQR